MGTFAAHAAAPAGAPARQPHTPPSCRTCTGCKHAWPFPAAPAPQLRRTQHVKAVEQQLDAARARAVFVTHMHGDHCFGVGGVLAAVQEARRGTAQQGEPLLLFGPPELQSLVLAAVR